MKKSGWMLCLIMLLLTSPVWAASSTTGCAECEQLLTEAQDVIVQLMDEAAGLRDELASSSAASERIVRETAERAVAAAVRPLRVEIAGLQGELALQRKRAWGYFGAGAGIGSAVVVILWVLLGHR